MRLLTYLYREDALDKVAGYAWIYMNRDHCETMIRRMNIFVQTVKQDAALKELIFECDDPLDPVAEFFLCDPLEDLDHYLSNGACIFPVSSHNPPIEALAACIDDKSQMDEEIEDMVINDEMELHTFSHLGEADKLVVTRLTCMFLGRPDGAEFSYRTSPIGRPLIVECKNMKTSAAGSATPQMDVVDLFQSDLKDLIKKIHRSHRSKNNEAGEE